MADNAAPATAGQTDEVLRALEQRASGLPPEVFEADKAREDEWSEYVATETIFYGGVRSANVGDAVPKSVVEDLGYDKLGWVAKRSTKAGKAALESIGVEV